MRIHGDAADEQRDGRGETCADLQQTFASIHDVPGVIRLIGRRVDGNGGAPLRCRIGGYAANRCS